MISNLDPTSAKIWTEGKTDWKILKRALEVLGLPLKVSFHDSDKDMGDVKLLQTLQTLAQSYNPNPLIFIFDRDNKDLISKVEDTEKGYKEWGNNVYSFALPIPTHRTAHENVCIEMYFTDDEIKRKDSHGRRLFLSSEFSETSGKFLSDSTIHYVHKGGLRGYTEPTKSKIIDLEVFDSADNNLALSKASFASLIQTKTPPFDDFDFKEFAPLFELISRIIEESIPPTNIYFRNLDEFFEEIQILDGSEQFLYVFEMIKNVISLGLQLFIIATIRSYEDEIINEPENYRKKVVQVKKIITEAFRKPSLITLTGLAEKCYFLVDSRAPDSLKDMKESLAQNIQLGDIGHLLDDLEVLFPPEFGTPKIVDKANLRRDFLTKMIPDLAYYMSKPQEEIMEGMDRVVDQPTLQIGTWMRALVKLVELLQPMFLNPIVFRDVEKSNPLTGEYTYTVKTYRNGRVELSEEVISRGEDDYESRVSEMILGANQIGHLYPLLLVKNDALYFYRRTMPSGYEYYSIVHDTVHKESTKRKFSYSLFKVGSKQELFWTDVLPTTNPENGIRANIPEEGPTEFVGRRKPLNRMKDEIISIINENGMIYGLGGIGKTALMIQLSKELYFEKDKEKVPYNSIIWVSAKKNFYDYILDSVEVREPQIQSLDNILYAILRFFDLENLEEYTFEDRKELVIELLQDEKILLFVDNYETIPPREAIKIVEFFGTEVKKRLRNKPQNFKIIITSREYKPTPFRPIELRGLDLSESKRLIKSVCKRYKSAESDLTDDQMKTMHEQTKGIPILIKHCIAKIYEYKKPFNTVISSLPQHSIKVVQFSYQEILEQIEEEKDKVRLKLLLLLETIQTPLLIRQMSDILEVDELILEDRIPLLLNFECLKRINEGNYEKYELNDEIRLLTKSLFYKHKELYQEVRSKFFRNYSIDKQLDYSSEEEVIIGIFDNYLREHQYTEAQDFINEQLKLRPESILLNYYYARFLKERTFDYEGAIQILEKVRETSGNHTTILKLLFSCYASLSIPKFEKTSLLIEQITENDGGDLKEDVELQLEIIRFYIRWSITVRMQQKVNDVLDENIRQAKYKELAKKALSFLNPLETYVMQNKSSPKIAKINIHEIYYWYAESYFNLWDYEKALKMIDKAIKLAESSSQFISVDEYEGFRNVILSTKDFYQKNPWTDRRQTRARSSTV